MTPNHLLSLIGLAKRAGRLEVGEEPVGAAARARHARLILLAADAADNTLRRARHFAEAGNAPWIQLPFTKAELGGAVGRSSCAMAALTDVGLASSLCAKLAALDAERYGDLAAQLDVKAQKALQRQAEQRRHEKKLQKGKARSPAPPKNADAARQRIARKAGRRERPEGAPASVKKGPAPRGGAYRVKGKLPRSPGPGNST